MGERKKGESFADLAKKYSEGPGADEGGDLGFFSSSKLEPELRKIVEALKPGGLSDLIVRSNGVQILKLVSKEGGVAKPLEEVQDAIFSALAGSSRPPLEPSPSRNPMSDSRTRL